MQDKKTKGQPSRADRFWSIFLFTKDGKVKSPLIIYSFSMSFVLIAIYTVSYAFFIDPVHLLLLSSPAWLVALLESLIPALAGCALLCLLQKIIVNKLFIPAAYIWLLAYALFILAWMMLSLENGDDREFFLALYARLVPAPVVIGGAGSWLLYLRKGKTRRGGSPGLSLNRNTQSAASPE